MKITPWSDSGAIPGFWRGLPKAGVHMVHQHSQHFSGNSQEHHSQEVTLLRVALRWVPGPPCFHCLPSLKLPSATQETIASSAQVWFPQAIACDTQPMPEFGGGGVLSVVPGIPKQDSPVSPLARLPVFPAYPACHSWPLPAQAIQAVRFWPQLREPPAGLD